MKTDRYCLFVSDQMIDSESINALEALLCEQSIDLVRVDSANGAFEAITRRSPEIIFTLATVSNQSDWLAHIVDQVQPTPVIAFSFDAQFPVINALRDGASDFFYLPIAEQAALAKSVQRHLNRAKLLAESKYLREELERSLGVLREDQQAGHHVQQKMLPPAEALINNYRFEYRIKPSLFLSGDFIDFFKISDSLTLFYLADISGHGASSAFVTVLLKNMTNRLLRNYNRGSSFHILSPTDILSRINKELLDTGLGKHLTIFIGLLDSVENTLQYGAGGHFPMPILYQNGKADYLAGTGMPVGLFDDAEFEGRIVPLADKFTLTLFSDGILEILDLPNLKAKENLLLETAAQGYDNLEDLVNALGVDDVDDAPDDIAALNVSRVVC